MLEHQRTTLKTLSRRPEGRRMSLLTTLSFFSSMVVLLVLALRSAPTPRIKRGIYHIFLKWSESAICLLDGYSLTKSGGIAVFQGWKQIKWTSLEYMRGTEGHWYRRIWREVCLRSETPERALTVCHRSHALLVYRWDIWKYHVHLELSYHFVSQQFLVSTSLCGGGPI